MSSVVNSHAAIVGDTTSVRKVQRALVSVFNKDNIEELGKFLHSLGVEILSTGGTAKKLIQAGIPVTAVDDYTGSPEILNGRVKTLHPKIHGGILSVRGNATHEADMEAHGVKPIDMVVVNLYPFQQTVAKVMFVSSLCSSHFVLLSSRCTKMAERNEVRELLKGLQKGENRWIPMIPVESLEKKIY